ncbi:MAG: hypothetical protein ACK40G_05730 [Cytophagaceae bacterium]
MPLRESLGNAELSDCPDPWRIRVLLFFIFFFPLLLSRQQSAAQINQKKCIWVKPGAQSFLLDSGETILPQTVFLKGSTDTTFKIIEESPGIFYFTGNNFPDSVLVCYTVFPAYLTRPFFRRDPAQYDSSGYYRDDFGYRKYNNNLPQNREELFSTPGLNKTGNIARGVSFGNNQNVFVNSVLNLQLEGKLTDDINITAVISDQNIPFQPEGNTQQIQEFDKVYVQLEHKNATVIAGDVVMQNKASNFLRYYRNVQGAQANVYLGKDSTASVTSAGAAMSKGKFASITFGYGQTFPLFEGVQGPYRLRGANNERFIIVLANSEKVFLDGNLLTRGFDYDYVIDYNLAEITFTNRVLITKFSRIRIDFEYSDRNYARTTFTASHHQRFGKASGYFNYYQEKDNPRNPLFMDLTADQMELLSQVGDTINRAYIPSAEEVAFSVNKVLYKNIGTSANPIYVYSTNPDSARWEVRFSEFVNGSYILKPGTANGKVYEFVGPGNGNFEPYLLVPTPKKKQMFTIGGSYDITSADAFYGEVAFSQNDINLYSGLNTEDDNGKAFKVGYVNKGKALGQKLPGYKWTAAIDYEFDEKNFTFIDRLRSVDFERDWSANPEIAAEDHIFNVAGGIIKDPLNNIAFRFSGRKKGEDVNGSQQYFTFNKSIKRIQILSNGFLMGNRAFNKNSEWRRYDINTFYTGKYLVPGVIISEDKNIVTDSLGKVTSSQMYFDEVKFYVRNNDSLRVKFFADYSVRNNSRPFTGEIVHDSKAQTTNAGFSFRVKQNHEFMLQSTYRYLTNYKVGGMAVPNEETVMGRLDWNSYFLKKHIRSEVTLTSGTGRELRREYMFIPVGSGLGTHVWLDMNNDGVQDLNEFFEKKFNVQGQQEFIKTFVPTDDYIKAYSSLLNYRLDISSPRNWMTSESGLKRFFSRFSNFSSWTINKKILDEDLLKRFVPLSEISDENIISIQQSVRSSLFYNRSHPKYGLDLNYLNSENKQLLTQGFERRIHEEGSFGTRLNIKTMFSVKTLSSYGFRIANSDFLQARNFRIRYYQVSPEIAYQPHPNFRVTFLGAYRNKENLYHLSQFEKVDIYEGGGELRFSKVSQRTISAVFKYIKINERFGSTPVNSALGYEMLEALQPGNNYTWNINWQERLASGLQLSFNYEGRKSEGAGIIHIGRMQVSALF